MILRDYSHTPSYLSIIITSYKTDSKPSRVKSLKRETESVYYSHSSLMFMFMFFMICMK